jgi:hypothetical protein
LYHILPDAAIILGTIAWQIGVVWAFARYPRLPHEKPPPRRRLQKRPIRRWRGEKPDDVVAVYSDLW